MNFCQKLISFIAFLLCNNESFEFQKQLLKYSHDPFVWQDGSRLSVLHAIQSAMRDLEAEPSALSCPSLIQIGTECPIINVSVNPCWFKPLVTHDMRNCLYSG